MSSRDVLDAGARAAPSRLRYLDGYRGVAALAVLTFHVAGRSHWVERSTFLGLDGGALIARLGNYGVCVFFLLSGMVLYRPFVAAHLSGDAPPRVRPYLRRRLLRIFPAYLLAVSAFYGLGLMSTLESPMTTPEYVWQYLLVQNYVRRGFMTSLPVAWTLCIEMAFYLLLPLLAVTIRRLPGGRSSEQGDRMRAQLAGLVVLYCLGWSYRVLLFAARPHWPGSPPNWLPSFLDWFALGMALAALHCWREHGGRLPRWLTTVADLPWLCWVFAAQLYWVSVQAHIPARFMDDAAKTLLRFGLNGLSALLLLLPAVLGTSSNRVLRALESPACTFLGTISYGIYLWHLIVIRWAGRLDVEPGLGFAPRLVLVAIVTVAVSYASYRVVELPAMSWRRGRQRSAPVPVAPALIVQ